MPFEKKKRKKRDIILGWSFLVAFVLGFVTLESIPPFLVLISNLILGRISYVFVFLATAIYLTIYILIWVYGLDAALEIPFIRKILSYLIKFHIGEFQPFKKIWKGVVKIRGGKRPKFLEASIVLFFAFSVIAPAALKLATIWCSVSRSRFEIVVLLVMAWIKVAVLVFVTGGIIKLFQIIF